MTTVKSCRYLLAKGYTLLELSLVLLFIGTLFIGIILGYNHFSEEYRVSKFMEQHNLLIAKINHYFEEQPLNSFNDQGNLRPVFYNKSVIPQTIGQGTNMAAGKLCRITTEITNARQVWTVTYKDISRTACVALLRNTVGINKRGTASLQKVYQIDTSVGTFYDPSRQNNSFSVSDMASACDKDQNAVRITYYPG